MKPRFIKLISLLTFTIAFFLSVTSSQAQSFRGSIRGTVSDLSGLAVPNVKVTITNIATNELRETRTAEDGMYVFFEVPSGDYKIHVDSPDLQTAGPAKITVSVGVATEANLTVGPKAASIDVYVSDEIPLVQTSDATLSQIVERHLVQELPLNGRDFGKLVALSPGVTVEGSGVAGTEKGFGQFNINGNRDRSNNYELDGTDNNDPFFNNSALNQVGITGAPATLLPLDSIEEFNLQSQFNAEYGRNAGSVVNIITRSGTNAFHGSLYQFNRNSFFDARNYFNTIGNPQSRFNNNNFGGSVGGPIRKDKTFFFLAYEGQRERVGSDFSLSVPIQQDIATARTEALAANPAINATPLDKVLALFPVSNTRSLAYSVRDQNDSNNFILKLDHHLTKSTTFTGRYAFGQSDQAFPLGSLGGFGSGSRIANFEQLSPTRVQVLSTSLLSTLSSSQLNELRFGYSRFRTNFNSKDEATITPASLGLDLGTSHNGLPEIDFNGVIENLGATAFSVPRGRVSETFQVLDDFTWLHGRHIFKFGGEFHRYDVQSFNDNLERGLLDVSSPGMDPDPVIDSLIGFYLGDFSTSADSGNTHRFTFNNNYSFFGQDELRLRSNLTVTAGLRWEYFGPLGEKHNLLSNFDSTGNLVQVGSPTLPHVYNRDLNNFAPRIGIAWNVRGNTVVRAAYGFYYDYTPQNNLIANFTTSAGLATNPVPALAGTRNFVGGLTFNQGAWNGTASGPVFSPSAGPQSIFITPLNLRTPYVQNRNLNIQHQFASALAFELGYVGSKGTKLTRLYDRNQDFTNPNFAAIDVFSDGANSTYNALQTTVRLQNFHRFSGFSTYTWSKSLDGASDGIDFNFATAAFPQNSDNLKAEKGPSTFDTRHRWTSALNYQLPAFSSLPKRLAEGWQLNSIITVQSGRPIPIITSNDTSGTFNFHQRPNIVPGVNPFLANWTPDTGYLNSAAFTQPAQGTFGNLGRNQIYGPGFWNIDFSFSKNTQVTEKLALQFRSEFFNIFNHPNFALPGNVISPGSGPIGVITQTPDVAQGNPGLGGGGPRVIQLALRLQF
jgi:hypothetical protein